MFSYTFKNAMEIGYYFTSLGYEDDERTSEWTGSGECSMFTKMILNKMYEEGFNILTTFQNNVEEIIELINSYENASDIEDHMWDDYCKGFLAGEIIGYPNKANLELVKKADELWNNPDYGYYQEVLNEVKNAA